MLNKEKGRFELLYNPDFFAKIAARDEKFIKGIPLGDGGGGGVGSRFSYIL